MATTALDPTTGLPLNTNPAATPAPAPAPAASPDTTSLMQQAASKIATDNQVVPLTNDFDESSSAASRVNNIIDQNSPLMQQAATSGTQLAAARGLTNSSLAAQASQGAVLTAATPLATTDAQLAEQNSLANLAAKNQAAITNANNGVSLGTTGMTLDNSNAQQDKTLTQQQSQFNTTADQAQQQINAQIDQFAKSLGISQGQLALGQATLSAQDAQYYANLVNQKSIADVQAATTKAVAGLQTDTQLQVAQLQADNQSAIQGNANIATAWTNTMANIATIQNNPNLEQGAKTTLIQNNLDSFQSFTNFWQKTAGVGADVSDLLKFTVAAPVTAPTSNDSNGTFGAPAGAAGGPLNDYYNQGGGGGQ